EATAGSRSHIFSTFLTWMQEKPPLVFVAATANRIELLPAEMIRKGRFDQVFFVDLPDRDERAETLRIHLRANDADPDRFDIGVLVLEIAQVVAAARVASTRHGRRFDTAEIVEHARSIVPLSRTMSEQIKAMRN
ncbi:MAG: hypothetical protein GWN79_19855, partial [Actinobacteria bacterium]|nr:hypothetical protein [Actinomycetota bacterium]NIS34481.1 hypothetical protein [Actinomycetota bacterium]NIT97520.1 hypothetical protein [Actinomycetota bacterium]NIU21185.1 hypothetical protein [Actinomycetota bacterium]NIU69251.1 hypothetical protein [Actinomycetota bacterium]